MTGEDARAALASELARLIYDEDAGAMAMTDALLAPGGAVDRIAADRAADELDAAAGYWDRPGIRTIAADLRERAIALRAADRP
jgi:hypothetical protein